MLLLFLIFVIFKFLVYNFIIDNFSLTALSLPVFAIIYQLVNLILLYKIGKSIS